MAPTPGPSPASILPRTMLSAPRLAGSSVLVLSALLAALAAPSNGPGTTLDVPRDDLSGRWVLHETAPITPIVFDADGEQLFTFNQPGARLLRLHGQTLERNLESPAGAGLVSLARRPGTGELWAVDSVTSSVGVYTAQDGRLLRSIRVGAQPHGIVFSASGDRAFVTCSAVDRVDVIDAAAYAVVNQIPIPARNPRAIARVGATVYVTPFLSGNGTSVLGNAATGDPYDGVTVAVPGDQPGTQRLPDRDLFAIPIGPSPHTDALDPAATVSGLGTILFNLRKRPWSRELWIPHTDALNAQHRGERSFLEGQVVRNRIAIVDVTPGGPPRIDFVDLDALAPAPELRCAAPTDVAFTSDGARAFVAGYGSDTIAVLDTTPGQVSWLGTIRITPSDLYPDGSGSRNVAIDPSDRWLYVFNKGAGSITRVDLAQLPSGPGFVVDSPQGVSLGWDPTPVDLVQGRIHFIRTANSKSFTSACNSCHVDGYLDGLAWDLGAFLDPEGSAAGALEFPLDDKGPMVTQGVRHLKEVGPYHWRGERKRLVHFNPTFIDLFEREENGVPKHLGGRFMYIVQYMEHLAIPPNPRQRPDRGFTPEEARGAEIFHQAQVQGQLTCVSCHALPLGTLGEVVDNKGGGLSPTSVVPPLRGLESKLSPPFDVGGAYGMRNELGVGLGHAGTQPTIQDVLLRPLPPPQSGPHFAVTPDEADHLAAFLLAFDTGLAPATAWQATVHPDNAGTFVQDELAFLLGQADRGHCEVVYSYGPELWHGIPVWFRGLYQPATGTFRQASVTLPPLTPQQLVLKGRSGTPVTFFGVPRMMGWSVALDRDNDKLLDLDELLLGTWPENPDSDNDGFTDGHEVQHGMDPRVADAGSPDAQPPQVVGAVRFVYVTSNAVKVEFQTDEPVHVVFSYNGGGPVLRAPLKPKTDDRFSEVLSELQPDTFYQVRLALTDVAGNQALHHFEFRTASLVLPPPARVEALSTQLVPTGGASFDLRAAVQLGFGQGSPAAGYEVEVAVYYRSNSGAALRHLGLRTATSDALGRAEYQLTLPRTPVAGSGRVHFVVLGARAPAGAPVYAASENTASSTTFVY